jgi:hypothetical protein
VFAGLVWSSFWPTLYTRFTYPCVTCNQSLQLTYRMRELSMGSHIKKLDSHLPGIISTLSKLRQITSIQRRSHASKWAACKHYYFFEQEGDDLHIIWAPVENIDHKDGACPAETMPMLGLRSHLPLPCFLQPHHELRYLMWTCWQSITGVKNLSVWCRLVKAYGTDQTPFLGL